jgi:hypothetical protein
MLKAIERIIVKILPYAIYRFLGGFYGVFIKRNSYSQYGEDLIILEFFKKQKKQFGTYLDIGAFHPIFISNTHLMHKLGWKGFVVDIDNQKLQAFKLIRGKKVTTFFNAVTPIEYNEKIVCYKFKRMWSEIDTLSIEVAEKTKKETGIDYFTDLVSTISVNQLFQITGRVDLLNIDIEGLDNLIIESIDFEKYGPSLIIFEDNETWGGSRSTLSILESNGYSHLFTSNGSVGYCRING